MSPRPLTPRISLSPSAAVVRTAKRHPLAVDVDLLCGETFFAGVSGNISEGGVFIAADVRPLGTILHVRFTLPGELGGGRTMMLVAEVRWISDGGMGLRFVRVKAPDLERIRAFVAERSVEIHPIAAFL